MSSRKVLIIQLTTIEDSPPKLLIPVKRSKLLQDYSEGPDKKKARLAPIDEDENKSVEPLSVAISLAKSDTKKKSASGDNEDTAKEESKDGTRTLRCTEKDVLSGRGGRTNFHHGNVYFRKLILSQCPAYEKATKTMKPKVSHQIVKNIRERGGRFLRCSFDGTYYDIGEFAARRKTSQALRHRSFETRNQLDPNRPKTNGRWTGRKEEQKEANIQNKPSSTNNPLNVPDTKSIHYHPGQINSAVASQAPQFQSHGGRIDAPPLILHAGSTHPRNVEGPSMPLQQSGNFHQSNESIIQQRSKLLRSISQCLDLLRFHEHNLPSSSLYNNSYTRSNVLLNPTMHPMQSTQPSYIQSPIFQGSNANIWNNYPTFSGHYDNARQINDVLTILPNPATNPMQFSQPSHAPPSIFQGNNSNMRRIYPTVSGHTDNARLINDVLPALLNLATNPMQFTQPSIFQGNNNNTRNNYPTIPGHNDNARLINDVTEWLSRLYNERNERPPSSSSNPPH